MHGISNKISAWTHAIVLLGGRVFVHDLPAGQCPGLVSKAFGWNRIPLE
jgi:hypothetical protein